MESFYHEFGKKIYNDAMAKRTTPRYTKPGAEMGDGSYGDAPNDDTRRQDYIVTETIHPPRLPSQFFRRKPVFLVEHVHDTAGEENQDVDPVQHHEPKRPMRRKTGGFKFKLGS